jgi:hypothetical protein
VPRLALRPRAAPRLPARRSEAARAPPQTPFIPAQAGIQGWMHGLKCMVLGPRLRGDERVENALVPRPFGR